MISPSPSTSISPIKTQHLHYLRQTIELAKLSPPKPTNFRVGCVLVAYPTSASTPTSGSTGEEKEEGEEQGKGAKGEGKVISTGYTLELPGNTHAEQNALSKLTSTSSTSTSSPTSTIDPSLQNVYLYTSLIPCSLRLSGNLPCVQRIIATNTSNSNHTPNPDQHGNTTIKISKIIFGAKEPHTFVSENQSCKLLTEAGLEWEYIHDLEGEILGVAMEGHAREVKNWKEEEGDKQEDKEGEKKEGVKSEFLHDRVDSAKESSGGKLEADHSNEEERNEEERRRQEEMEVQPRNSKKRMMEL